jgi:hypothetical protein
MDPNQFARDVPRPSTPVQDEWGIFDPEQAGLAAVLRRLREMTWAKPAPAAPVHASKAPRF